jgi:hypothetical protein
VRIPKKLMPHGGLFSFKPKTGEGTYGPVFGDEVTPKRCYIEDKRRLVRSSDGAEVVSQTRVWVDPEVVIPEGSEATVWKGTARERTALVVGGAYREFPGLPAHAEVDIE